MLKEIELIEKHKEELNRIVVNASASQISLELRKDINTIAESNGWKYCATCAGTQLFYLAERICREYRKYKATEKENKPTTNKGRKKHETTKV